MHKFNEENLYVINFMFVKELGKCKVNHSCIKDNGENSYNFNIPIYPLRTNIKDKDGDYRIENVSAEIDLNNYKATLYYNLVYKGGLVEFYKRKMLVAYNVTKNVDRYDISIVEHGVNRTELIKKESVF